jgi:hypothetical protein
MGQRHLSCTAPHLAVHGEERLARRRLGRLAAHEVHHFILHDLPHLRVAVQAEFESRGLKPVLHYTGSRVETRRLSSYGSTGFNLHSLTSAANFVRSFPRVVALQVAFEKQTLKPVFSFYRL